MLQSVVKHVHEKPKKKEEVIEIKEHEEFDCDQCEKKFETKNVLAKHKDMVHKEVPYNCTLCKKVFPNKRQTVLHLKVVHKVQVQDLVCGFCGKDMMFKEEYDLHMAKNHKEVEKVAEKVAEKVVEKAPEVVRRQEECRNGPKCTWKRAGRCMFDHPGGEQHREEQECSSGDWRSQRKGGFKKHQGANHQGAGPSRAHNQRSAFPGAGFQQAGSPGAGHQHAGHQGAGNQERRDGFQRLPSGRWGNVRNPGTPVQWCQAGDRGDGCTQGRECMYKHKSYYHMGLRALAQQHMAEGFTQQRMNNRK